MNRRGAGIEIGRDGDRHVVRAQGRDRRRLLFPQIIEGARQEDRNGAGLGDRLDAVLVEIFDMIDGKRVEFGGEPGAAQIGELLGMELDRQPELRAAVKTCPISSTEKAMLSQKPSTASASPPERRQRLLADEPHICRRGRP